MAERSRPTKGSRPDPVAWTAEALATRRMQRLQPSMGAAGEMVNRARTHLESADLIAGTDPTLAVSTCHDAARQAITAHMRAAGYRVANEAGSHRFVLDYASVVLAGVVSEDDIVALDDLRRDRHTAEYGDFASKTITTERARQALELATRVVASVARTLAEQSKQ